MISDVKILEMIISGVVFAPKMHCEFESKFPVVIKEKNSNDCKSKERAF